MSVLENILRELDELYIVEHVTKKHNEARMKYTMNKNTVSDDTEFDDVISDYFNHHYTKCVSGGTLSRADAAGMAKEIISQEYRKKGQDMLKAYADGKDGTNHGMRAILDIIMERLSDEAIERHVRDVIDRYVAPTSFDEQVSIVKEIIIRMRISSRYVDVNRPERYARNYEELIRALVETNLYNRFYENKNEIQVNRNRRTYFLNCRGRC